MTGQKKASVLLVGLAFAAVYLIWGSTYFFIEMGVKYIPPAVLGAIRFSVAGVLILLWLFIKGEKIWNPQAVIPSLVSGVLLLFIGNGAVIWVEQFLPSSFVAIFLASGPLCILLLDKANWQKNFSNRFTLMGVTVGLVGVIALFYEKIAATHYGNNSFWPLIVLCIANIGWCVGSLYSKYKVQNVSPLVNAAWQMIAAGIAFTLVGIFHKDFSGLQIKAIPLKAWLALTYLIIFGSIIAYSAYIFLLSVRSATQVSTYAYVNPLVAVLLGVYINNDNLTMLQLSGLAVILLSVFFVNQAKRIQVKTKRRIKTEI